MSALALSIFSLCNTDPSSHHKTEQNKNLEMSPWGEKKMQGSVIFLTRIQPLSWDFPKTDLENF